MGYLWGIKVIEFGSRVNLSSRCLEEMGEKNEQARKTSEERGYACPRGPWKSFLLALWESGKFLLVKRLKRFVESLKWRSEEIFFVQKELHHLHCWLNAYHQNLDNIDEMKCLPGVWIWKKFHYYLFKCSQNLNMADNHRNCQHH